jgi:hypothetical protein
MTMPGKLVERMQGITPNLIAAINRRLPLTMVDSGVDSSQRSPQETVVAESSLKK